MESFCLLPFAECTVLQVLRYANTRRLCIDQEAGASTRPAEARPVRFDARQLLIIFERRRAAAGQGLFPMGAMETPRFQLNENTVFPLKGGAGGVFPKGDGKWKGGFPSGCVSANAMETRHGNQNEMHWKFLRRSNMETCSQISQTRR